VININKQLQQQIEDAKQLLEKYAPPGEYLAYINKKEGELLKKHGGAGVKIPETNIPSYFYWYAAALAVSAVTTYMGSMHQAKRLKTAANWDKYNKEQKRIYEKIQINKQAAELLSEKRARTGAAGVTYQGSSLLDELTVIEDYDDKMFWLNKGIDREISLLDVKSQSEIAETKFKGKTDTLTTFAMAYGSYDRQKSLFGENS
jgi:hypothetical protein